MLKLTDETFMDYAAANYDFKRSASYEEFQEDIKRFSYIKRLFNRYSTDQVLQVRLILNHMIILYNCFGEHATPLLFMKLDSYHSYLKPFVIFLNYMPEIIQYNGLVIRSSDIPLDANIVKELRNL